MNARFRRLLACAGLALCSSASALAANYSVNWMQLAPTPFGNAPPFNGNYNLPGIGSVNMTYSAHADFTEARFQVPQLASGSVNFGPDSYSWNNQETLARTNWGFSGVTNSSWFVTYTFSNPIPAGNIVLGVQGLGRRDPNPGETVFDTTTQAIVLQNGTHLGDYTGAMNVGATLFTGGPGSFTMENSVSGPGGADPWWNTGLALVRIDDVVSSLTVRINHTSGDGIGVNIGAIVPEPSTAALLALGGLATLMRRR